MKNNVPSSKKDDYNNLTEECLVTGHTFILHKESITTEDDFVDGLYPAPLTSTEGPRVVVMQGRVVACQALTLVGPRFVDAHRVALAFSDTYSTLVDIWNIRKEDGRRLLSLHLSIFIAPSSMSGTSDHVWR